MRYAPSGASPELFKKFRLTLADTLRNTLIILIMKTRTRRVPDKKRTTISLSADLLAKGKERARETRRNFSNYMEILIEADARQPEVKVS